MKGLLCLQQKLPAQHNSLSSSHVTCPSSRGSEGTHAGLTFPSPSTSQWRHEWGLNWLRQNLGRVSPIHWPVVCGGEQGPVPEAATSQNLASVQWPGDKAALHGTHSLLGSSLVGKAQLSPQYLQQWGLLPSSLVLTLLSLSCGLDGISLSPAKPRALVSLGHTTICRQGWQGHVLGLGRLLCWGQQQGEQGGGLRKVGWAPVQLPPAGLLSCHKNCPSAQLRCRKFVPVTPFPTSFPSLCRLRRSKPWNVQRKKGHRSRLPLPPSPQPAPNACGRTLQQCPYREESLRAALGVWLPSEHKPAAGCL